MLYRTVSLKRNVSCVTMPICARSDACVTSRESSEWPIEHNDRGREREERSRRHVAVDDTIAAVPERRHDAERAGDLHERFGELVGAHVLQREIEQATVQRVEAAALVLFAA